MLVVVIVFGGVFFFKIGFNSLRGGGVESWYAVHLTNGQVYFGQVIRFSSDSITMKDAYYFETYQVADNVVSKSKSFAVQQVPKQIYRLVALGDEKTPVTERILYLNRNAVLSWEKLSTDADVVNSIKAAEGQKTENRI